MSFKLENNNTLSNKKNFNLYVNEILTKDKSLNAILLLIDTLKEKYSLDKEEILNLISHKIDKDKTLISEEDISENVYLPLCIFYNNKLSSLEIIIKYLKENLNYNYHKIAILLNRDDRTIWKTYNNSIKKQRNKFDLKFLLKSLKNIYVDNFLEKITKQLDEDYENKINLRIPVKIFSDRRLGALENLVIYLKKSGFSLKEISFLLLKNYQTIYTSYSKGVTKIKTNQDDEKFKKYNVKRRGSK